MITRGLTTAALGGVAAAALPAATSWTAMRSRLLPSLAGIGSPDHVALTFDDGPLPLVVPRFLEVLARYEVHATFFLLAEQLQRDPAAGKALVAAGHEVAVHGYEHRCVALRGPAATRRDLTLARERIVELTGTEPVWYRPPYGVLSWPALITARQLGLTPVLWTSWGRDWRAKATPDSVLRTVTATLRGGGTVLLHDSDTQSATGSWRATLGALPRLLDECARRGLRVGPLAEHFASGHAATQVRTRGVAATG
ncbi:MAG: polysaccharide deacetylase family protein [Sciscionella sp.]